MNRENVPKLRFGGFVGEWEEKTLGEVSTFLDGRRKPIKSEERSKMKGQYPYYGASGIIDYVNNYIFDEELILLGEDGENIISRNLPLAFRVSGKCWINNHAHVIVPKENTNIDFLTHNLERINYVVYNTGTAQPKLNQEVCRSIPSWFPTLPEQQKIATFLTAVDEKTQQLSRKKELLEQYKKGVMQQLFSGKLRFKDEDGKDFGDWEEKTLGEISIITMGQSPESKSYNVESIGMLLIQGNADIKDRETLPRQWTSQPTKTCAIGDLILTVRAPVGAIAKSLHDACIGRGVCSIVRNKKSVQEYLYQFLLGYETRWTSLEQGSTFTAVSGSDIKGLKLNLPSIPEQQKIADFLSNIDTKIQNTNEQITHMQNFKKGLLQQLFV